MGVAEKNPPPVTSSDLDRLPRSQDLLFGTVRKVLDGAVLLQNCRTGALGATEYWSDTSGTSSHFTRASNLAEPQAARPRSEALGTGTVEKAKKRARSLPKMGPVALGTTEQGEDVIGYPPQK